MCKNNIHGISQIQAVQMQTAQVVAQICSGWRAVIILHEAVGIVPLNSWVNLVSRSSLLEKIYVVTVVPLVLPKLR